MHMIVTIIYMYIYAHLVNIHDDLNITQQIPMELYFLSMQCIINVLHCKLKIWMYD